MIDRSESIIVTKRTNDEAVAGIVRAIARVGHDENDTRAVAFLVMMLVWVMHLIVVDGNDIGVGQAPMKQAKNLIEGGDVIVRGTNVDEGTLRIHHWIHQMTENTVKVGKRRGDEALNARGLEKWASAKKGLSETPNRKKPKKSPKKTGNN